MITRSDSGLGWIVFEKGSISFIIISIAVILIAFTVGYHFGYNEGYYDGMTVYCSYNNKLVDLTNTLIDFANEYGSTVNATNITYVEYLEVCNEKTVT